jgi:hypothetical protein
MHTANEVKHTHKNMQLVQGRTQFTRARQIMRTLGIKTAARYMSIRGYSVECSMFELLGV